LLNGLGTLGTFERAVDQGNMNIVLFYSGERFLQRTGLDDRKTLP
jgi:hypothetical protein